MKHHGFEGFSPFTRPGVIQVAEGIPFIQLTQYDVPTLYALKGEVVKRGVNTITGVEMPIFEKRRFQHGALRPEQLRKRVPNRETELRRKFLGLYAS
jgi:asparagine synthase (glutamine-hydrolysing)